MNDTQKRRSLRSSLLVEVGTEELPPTSLRRLGESFSRSLAESLSTLGLSNQKPSWFATPRRLAVLIPEVARQQPDQVSERRGPAISAAFDNEGCPTLAAKGFAKSCSVTVDQLERLETNSGGWLLFRSAISGKAAHNLIPDCINTALRTLPIAKRMRWGEGDAEFVRPIHWLLVLHGKTPIHCEILGVSSGVISHGHRFLSEKPIQIKNADVYPATLKENSFVIADFNERREVIRQQITVLGHEAGGKTIVEDSLLELVTGLVEWPKAVLGAFDPDFLKIPPEVLISSMRDHQKFFHVVDKEGALLPKFITVSNIDSKHMSRIRSGNEQVLQARLSDARFFWKEDCKQNLNDWVENLRGVSFHIRLGSLHDKMRRIKKLSTFIITALGWDPSRTLRSAHLCKADLISQMVGEFPELQGTMGYHYSRQNKEHKEVSVAIAEHYLPKYSGDKLPSSRSGKILAIADRIDTLTGIFSTGDEPTGESDPYGLRRAALGVIRILVEKKLALDLTQLVNLSILTYIEDDHLIAENVRTRVIQFVTDRYRHYYASAGFSNDEISAVLEIGEVQPIDFYRRLRAISQFRRNRSAAGLSEATKRIRNVLKKSDQEIPLVIDSTLFESVTEEQLAASLVEVSATVIPLIKRGEYLRVLKQLALLREPVDSFFSEVMVLTDNAALRTNRLALLNQLSKLLLIVGDISKLQPTT